jgi:hypothetical protein
MMNRRNYTNVWCSVAVGVSVFILVIGNTIAIVVFIVGVANTVVVVVGVVWKRRWFSQKCIENLTIQVYCKNANFT